MAPTIIVVNIILACVMYYDAKQIGLKKGYVSGFGNMTAPEWMIVAIFLPLVPYPIYMLYRPRYKAAAANAKLEREIHDAKFPLPRKIAVHDIVINESNFQIGQESIEFGEVKDIDSEFSKGSGNIGSLAHGCSLQIRLHDGREFKLASNAKYSGEMEKITEIGGLMCQKTFAQRFASISLEMQQTGFHRIPMAGWASTISDDEPLDFKRPTPDESRTIVISSVGDLVRGDGYKVNLRDAFKSNRLWLGVQRNVATGRVRSRLISPFTVRATVGDISAKSGRIEFQLSWNKDVLLSLLTTLAKND